MRRGVENIEYYYMHGLNNIKGKNEWMNIIEEIDFSVAYIHSICTLYRTNE